MKKLMDPSPTLTDLDWATHEAELKFLRDRLHQGRPAELGMLLEKEIIAPSVIIDWYPAPKRTLLKGGIKFTVRVPDTESHAVCCVQHWLGGAYWTHVSYIRENGASFTRLSLTAPPQEVFGTLTACVQTVKRDFTPAGMVRLRPGTASSTRPMSKVSTEKSGAGTERQNSG
jgi:hypothetical protein